MRTITARRPLLKQHCDKAAQLVRFQPNHRPVKHFDDVARAHRGGQCLALGVTGLAAAATRYPAWRNGRPGRSSGGQMHGQAVIRFRTNTYSTIGPGMGGGDPGGHGTVRTHVVASPTILARNTAARRDKHSDNFCSLTPTETDMNRSDRRLHSPRAEGGRGWAVESKHPTSNTSVLRACEQRRGQVF